jgi:hypothetical protein
MGRRQRQLRPVADWSVEPDIAGFRWDGAIVPQATTLDNVNRQAFVAFIDLVALSEVGR